MAAEEIQRGEEDDRDVEGYLTIYQAGKGPLGMNK